MNETLNSSKVAVVIPVHNVEAYLDACLESVCRQSLRCIEIICVDDASTDASPQILANYAKLDPRIKIVRHEINEGLSVARNTGLAYVTAPWVVFVDSDDVVSGNLCRHCLQEAERMHADVVFFDYTSFEDGSPLPSEPLSVSAVPADRATLLNRQSFAWTKFTSTTFLREHGIEYPVGLCLQDVPVHWRLVLESERPVFLSEPLVWYRQRASSISYRSNWTRADGFIVYDLVREYLHRTQRWERWRPLFLQRELSIFADIHFNFVNTNPALVPRAQVEVVKRMTAEHWSAVLAGENIGRIQRDYILAECRPDVCPRIFIQIIPFVRHNLRNLFRRPWRILRRICHT